ncbi:MAG TPA: SCO family protein [Pyrinomonadaceae bacterium]|jgi:protein SCO1/2
MRVLILFLSVILLFTACQKAGTTEEQQTSSNAKRYSLKGKVIAADKAKKTATIEHGEVKGLMSAMTMDFAVKADWVWDDLTPGAEIQADLVVDETATPSSWLENIAISAAPNPNQPAPQVDMRFAQFGKEVPEFTLTNQDGKRISTSDFKGKTWAITFIYARCPLPDYCIRMSANFSDAALQIMNSELKDQFRLLSVSFDPANDTPEKLRQYGQGYLGKNAKPDFSVWQLAVGNDKEVRAIADFFGLRYETDPSDKAQINHSLRTAVVSPAGKITKIFAGNDFTADDLLAEMKAASGGK